VRLARIAAGTVALCLVVIGAFWYALTSAEDAAKTAEQDRAEARKAAEKEAGDAAWKRLQQTRACLDLKLAAAEAEQRGEHIEVPQPCREF
jgi:hypothetical protein